MKLNFFVFLVLMSPGVLLAQGQDSQPYERDLQVISTMLPGIYDNANQSYFDRRGDRSIKHGPIHIKITAVDENPNLFQVTTFLNGDMEQPAQELLWELEADADAAAAKLIIRERNGGQDKRCELLWAREAQQFRAQSNPDCHKDFLNEVVLGYQQLWVTYPNHDNGDYKLHRARAFECYADIPGVGGGRNEPYERYEGFKTHDQGGAVWFTTKDGRRLSISLFLVDWPINNYEGIFTRDSFVIYVSEEIDGERKEHGYAFTVPQADRIGINLKWMLASCFMKSNKFATPAM
ncbi:MAG: hypothetical protein AAF438_15735 [Pseudomonadota bacterium]